MPAQAQQPSRKQPSHRSDLHDPAECSPSLLRARAGCVTSPFAESSPAMPLPEGSELCVDRARAGMEGPVGGGSG